MSRRMFWWLYLLAVVLAFSAACSQAFAQAVQCTDTWVLDGDGFAVTHAGATGATYCAVEAARLSAFSGYGLTACTATDTTAHYTLTLDGASNSERAWTRQPAGCTVGTQPDPTGQPTEFTSAETGNLLLGGVLVLIFGVGYLGGRAR